MLTRDVDRQWRRDAIVTAHNRIKPLIRQNLSTPSKHQFHSPIDRYLESEILMFQSDVGYMNQRPVEEYADKGLWIYMREANARTIERLEIWHRWQIRRAYQSPATFFMEYLDAGLMIISYLVSPCDDIYALSAVFATVAIIHFLFVSRGSKLLSIVRALHYALPPIIAICAS